MEDYTKINTLVKCGVKMSNDDEGEKISFTAFKSIVESLRYLTYTHLDILYGVRLMSRFMKILTMTHFKVLKRILLYIKGVVDFSLFYRYSNILIL